MHGFFEFADGLGPLKVIHVHQQFLYLDGVQAVGGLHEAIF